MGCVASYCSQGAYDISEGETACHAPCSNRGGRGEAQLVLQLLVVLLGSRWFVLASGEIMCIIDHLHHLDSA